MKITLATALSIATLLAACAALTNIDTVKAIESEIFARRNIQLNAQLVVDAATFHHGSKSDGGTLETVGGDHDEARYTDEDNKQLLSRRQLKMGSMGGSGSGSMRSSGSGMRGTGKGFIGRAKEKGNGYYNKYNKGKFNTGKYTKGKYTKGKYTKGKYTKGKYTKGKGIAKGKGKGGYKPTPPRPTPPRPTPRPPTPPPAVLFETNCTLKNATLVTCDFARLAVNVTLDDPGQLAILMEDCGISSVTAIKNSLPRAVNVRDDPSTTRGNLVFLKGPPVNGGIGNGGCLTFQFRRGPKRVGVDLINMIVTALDDDATIEVSRRNEDFFSFDF
jgi:hypothetical protein